MRTAKSLLGLAALGLAPSAASGQTTGGDGSIPEAVVKAGDTVIGVGAMNNMTWIGLIDSKTWMAQVTTDFPDPNADSCLLSNGYVAMREGTPLFAPAGAILLAWNSIGISEVGDLGMLIRVKPAGTGTAFDAVYWNLVPVAKKDQLVPLPRPPFTSMTAPWDTFGVVKLNAKNELFIIGEIRNADPTTPRSKERALVRYQLDDAGTITGTTVLATEGMTIAGLKLAGQNCLLTSEHIIDLNSRGDFITMIAQDNVQWMVINMQTPVAKTGTPSPVGKLWNSFSQARAAINDRGDWVISGKLTPPDQSNDYLIVKNGQKFAQAGDLFPDISPLPMGTGSLAPIYIANTGDVFWHGRIGTSDSFMRNKTAIVTAGQSIVDNRLVTSILGGENGFAISPNGRFWLGNVQMQSIGTAALFVDFGLMLEIPGCRGNPGKLSVSSGEARVGMSVTLAMDRAQAPGAAAALYFSRKSVVNANGCGVPVRHLGELMLGAPILGHTSFPNWNGTSPSLKTFNIPNDISLVDSVLFAQGVFVSPGHPTEDVRLTNGMRIEVGAP